MTQARPKRGTVPAEFTDAARGIRLQKVLAEAGVASRRDCESLITAGRVTVNGKPVTALPAWVAPEHDRVEVDGQPLPRPSRKRTATKKTYLLLHKPRRVLCTNRDPQGRRTVIDLVASTEGGPAIAKRLFPVGRLDADSTGLILLTNDGQLANRLTHPRYEVAKQYRASVRGKLTEGDVQRLQRGLYLAHQASADAKPVRVKRAAMASVKLLGHTRDRARGDRTNLLITLREGQNREIRRMLARLGHKVRRLQRIAIGPLKLKGLAVGEWRCLTASEVKRLYKAAGLEPHV